MDLNFYKREYENVFPLYERLTKKNYALIKELLIANGIKGDLERRTKDLDSFLGKITRSGKFYKNPLKEITDLSGVRIILHSASEIEKVVTLIKENFNVDPQNSINKIKNLEPDRFGYLSQHFIVKSNSLRGNLPEWKDISELWSEIQVRTILQHAWASVEHFLLYKNTFDVPKEYQRRLFRLSALFELADEELDGIIKDIQILVDRYKKKLDEGNKNIDINIDSLKLFIETSDESKYWINCLRDAGTQVDEKDWGDLSRDIRFAKYFNLITINDLEKLLKDAHGWGEQFLVEYYNESQKFYKSKGQTVVNGAVTLLMVASNYEKIDSEILQTSLGWGNGQRLLDSAKKVKGKTL